MAEKKDPRSNVERDMDRLKTWKFGNMPGISHGVNKVFAGLSAIEPGFEDDEDGADFCDRLGRWVKIPKRMDGRPWFHMGYAQALWDFRNGDMLLGAATRDKSRQLFVRDVDDSGDNERLQTWHAISNIADEYHVPRQESNPVWDALMRAECRKLDTRVQHGVKFNDRAYITPWLDFPKGNAPLLKIDPDKPAFHDPFELVVDQEWDKTLVGEAVRFLRQITDGPNSLRNLLLMPATPFCEPYKHLSYVLAGEGGNGKGTLFSAFMESFPKMATSIDVERLVGGGKSSSTLMEQEPAKLMRQMWAFDEDAESLTAQQTPRLKKLSTGDTLTARKLGQDMVQFNPRATLCVATNLEFVTTLDASMRRRFVFVRMRDGQDPDDLEDLREFINENGAIPFLMASCEYWWKEGEHGKRDVQIGMPEQISEYEQWLVDRIVRTGFAESDGYPHTKWDARNANAKLGLRTARRGGRFGVVVDSEDRFRPYREYVRSLILGEQTNVTPPPAPMDGQEAAPRPDQRGFECDYTPARADKSAIGWKKLVADPDADTMLPPKDAKAFTCVPRPGYAVLDFDMNKSQPGGLDGWTAFSLEVGDYGSMGFPFTYVVRTPSGGAHAYYKLPEGVHLKDAVKAGGIPVDIRSEGRGYVIAPGSRTNAGRYEVADEHEVAVMPRLMVDWLASQGQVEGVEPTEAPRPASPAPAPGAQHGPSRRIDPFAGMFSKPTPGRTPGQPKPPVLTEGSRNSTLSADTYGRLLHYPQDRERIHDNMLQWGRQSGLRDSELEAIWRSAVKAADRDRATLG